MLANLYSYLFLSCKIGDKSKEIIIVIFFFIEQFIYLNFKKFYQINSENGMLFNCLEKYYLVTYKEM